MSKSKEEVIFNKRNTNDLKNSIYPWNNYDFDLTQYIKNNYNPEKLGFSDKPYLSDFTNDLSKIPLYPKKIIEKPILTNKTIAGKSDLNQKNINSSTYKRLYDTFKEPYPGFKQEYPDYFPLTGEKSSSYFLRIGTCPVKKIKDKNQCISKGYTWTSNNILLDKNTKAFFPQPISDTSSGTCSKPRYMYINNKTEPIKNLAGPLISLGQDITELNPKGLIDIFTKGQSSNKDMRPLPCIENFINYKSNNQYINYLYIDYIILLFLLILYIILLIY